MDLPEISWYGIAPLVVTLLMSIIFLVSLVYVKYYDTKQGKFLIQLPISYIIWSLILIVIGVWSMELDSDNMNNWCYFSRAGLVSTETLVELHELSLIVWFAILVVGTPSCLREKPIEYILPATIWFFSFFMAIFDYILSHFFHTTSFQHCDRNSYWDIILECYQLIQVLLMSLLTIYVLFYIKKKISPPAASIFHIFIYPIIFLLFKIPSFVGSVLEVTKVSFPFATSFYLTVASCSAGIFSAVFYGITRKIHWKVVKKAAEEEELVDHKRTATE